MQMIKIFGEHDFELFGCDGAELFGDGNGCDSVRKFYRSGNYADEFDSFGSLDGVEL